MDEQNKERLRTVIGIIVSLLLTLIFAPVGLIAFLILIAWIIRKMLK